MRPLSPARVRRSVRKAVADIRRLEKAHGKSYPSLIARQEKKYSKVRVTRYRGEYYLVYDAKSRTGTGGFKTRSKAVAWFMNGGR